MTDITELAQSLKNAASKALIDEGMTWFSEEQLSHEDGIAFHKADAEFIALANPNNVLALVEALEKSEKTSEARLEAIDITHKRAARERDRANAAEEALEKAQQRIAELESRTVKLPKPISVLHRREFTAAHCAIYAYPEAEVNAALDDAGIKVEAE